MLHNEYVLCFWIVQQVELQCNIIIIPPFFFNKKEVGLLQAMTLKRCVLTSIFFTSNICRNLRIQLPSKSSVNTKGLTVLFWLFFRLMVFFKKKKGRRGKEGGQKSLRDWDSSKVTYRWQEVEPLNYTYSSLWLSCLIDTSDFMAGKQEMSVDRSNQSLLKSERKEHKGS